MSGGAGPLDAASTAAIRAVLFATNDAVITLDGEGRVLLFNPAAEQLFGVPAEEAIGGAISRFVPPNRREQHDMLVRRFRDTGETTRQMGASRPISGLRANGEEFPMEAWISRADIDGKCFLTVVLRDISGRQLVEDARLQMLIAKEVEHRAKNALTAVQALVKTTPAETKEELLAALKGRIAAFSRGYSLLVMSAWQPVDLGQLVGAQLEAGAMPLQARIDGPAVKIAPEAVQPLSLVLHELSTNALKYGALSSERGVVDVCWKITQGPVLDLVWRESGGPGIAERPTRRGYGSELLEVLVRKQLRGSLDRDWRPEGLAVRLTLSPPLFIETSGHPFSAG